MLLHHCEKKEIIDYKKIVEFPYLEIKEGLHIFSGFKFFESYFEIRNEDIKNYLHREKIWWTDPWVKGSIYPSRFNSEHIKIFSQFYPKLLRANNYKLSLGLEEQCYQIKTIVPIHNTIPVLPLEERILYFWKTDHLLYWTIGEGLILPKELQTVFEISQCEIKSSFMLDHKINHLLIQSLAQLIWYLYPNEDSYLNVREKIKFIFLDIPNGDKKVMTPIDHLFLNTKKYFREEKTNVLDKLFKKADPRINKSKGRPKLIRPLPIKINSEILHKDKINFQKLKHFTLIIGAILFRLKIIEDVESALCHPILLSYLQNQNYRIKNFMKYWLLTILPSRNMNNAEKKSIYVPYLSDILNRLKAKSFFESIKGKTFEV